MQTSAISATTSASSSSSTAGLNRMTSEDFYNLLVTELQQQDPLEPTKTADMIGQVSQIRSIEQSAQLTQTLQQLTQQQRTAGASDLLGKYVEGVGLGADGNAALISGLVTSIRFGSDGTAIIELDSGGMLSANNITRVSDTAENVNATSATNAATSKSYSAARVRAKSGVTKSWLDSLLHPQSRSATAVRN
jgi:flagellar basal-body rod modification protein FlgD